MKIMGICKENGLQIGSLFKGRVIKKRLDRGRKPFREVYLCTLGREWEQVLILYRNDRVPAWLAEKGTMCPLEYRFRVRMRGNRAEGLPTLYEYGRDGSFTWLFEERLTEKIPLRKLLRNLNVRAGAGKNIFECLLEACGDALGRCRFLTDPGIPTMVTPDSIHVKLEGDTLALLFTGYDQMIAPMYPDRAAAGEYYDLGYADPELPGKYHGEYSASYSLVLSVLSSLVQDGPAPTGPSGQGCGAGPIMKELEDSGDLPAWIPLPDGYREVLGPCLQKDGDMRLSVNEALQALHWADDHGCGPLDGDPSLTEPDYDLDGVSMTRTSRDSFLLSIPSLGIRVPIILDPGSKS